MATIRSARPAKPPERVSFIKKAVKKVARKTGAKKTVAKKPSVEKPIARKSAAKKTIAKPKPAKEKLATADRKTAAAVAARRTTVDATNHHVNFAHLRIDPDDQVAHAKVERMRRTTAVDKLDRPPPAAGAALIERVSNAVERELLQIESIVGGSHVQKGQRTEAERRARTLASLARTLAEVRRLRAAEQPQRPADGPSAARDLDAFRRILWRRLEGMVGRTTPFPADGNESGGNG